MEPVPCPQQPITDLYPETNPVQNAHSISLRLILILSYLLCLGLSSGVLPTGFPSKILYIFLFTPSPDHLNCLDLITQMIFDWKLLIMLFSPASCHFCPLRPQELPQHLTIEQTYALLSK